MTHGPYAIIAERAIFLLSEMEDGAERIFFGQTGPNAAFESSFALSLFQITATNCCVSGRHSGRR